MKKSDAEILSPFVSDERKSRVDEVLGRRTRSITVVLDRIHDAHNASAVLRSCEAFGIQEVHVIESKVTPFVISRKVTQGCEKWLDITRYSEAERCLEALRERKFSIYASLLSDEALPIGDLDSSRPMALVFGNEHDGVSPEVRARCDGAFMIPMFGFSQSFNISVATALSLYHLIGERVKSNLSGDLTAEDFKKMKDRYYRLSVKSGERILARLRKP